MIKRRNLALYALRAFEAAVREGNLASAAEELGVTHSAISHQIRKLEDLLGTTLFDRRHKPLRLTAQGHLLLAGVTDSFDRLTRAAEGISESGLEGDLTVSCVPGLGTNWFVPILGDFLRSYAKLRVHVITEFWHHPSTHDDADIAIAYGSAEHPGKRVVRLGQSDFFPVCSPRISDALAQPHNLFGSTLLHDYSDETWARWLLEAGADSLEDCRNIFFDSAHLSLEAARAGFGVAMGDRPTVQRDLREGRLVRLFDHSVPAIHPYYITTPPTEHMKPAARALEAWIVERF
jgi:DNA-binding transcriptional LysR family regulator